jgi:hypothetical protein
MPTLNTSDSVLAKKTYKKLPMPQTETVPAMDKGTPVIAAGDHATDGGVTLRVVVLCLALAVFFGYAIPIIDYKLFNTFLGATHLPPGAIGVLLILLLVVNPLLALVSKRLRFSRNETLTVYITCLFSCLIPGHGGENFIIPNLIAPFYYATAENKWLGFLGPYLKPWLTPALTENGVYNRALVESWYTGGSAVPWGAWLVPLVFWGAFALLSYFMLGCLSVMLRAQWAEKEALAFPLLRLPIEMTADMDESRSGVSPFFRNPMMWIGFGLAVFIQVVNGLHVYFPDVPQIVLSLDTTPFLQDAPWNQIGGVTVGIFPIAVGIAYLLTSEVSFSLWFFFWFFKFQLLAAHALGFAPNSMPNASGSFPGKVFTGFQMWGAYLAYVAIILWMAREHLGHVARRAFGRTPSTPQEKDEAMSYPLAFWGFVLSLAAMIGATCVAGVRFDIALALWISYLVFAIGLTRVAVEGGLLQLLTLSSPLGGIARLLPGPWLTLENGLMPASMFQAGFVYHMRGFLMPSFIQSFKLAHDEKINSRRLMALLAGVIVLSLGVSWYQVVQLGYETGGLQLGHRWFTSSGSLTPARFVGFLSGDDGSSVTGRWVWVGVGGVLTYAMMLARSRLLWFPFHPVGYLMGLTFPIGQFWFSILLGWLCKVLLNRFGGHDTVRQSTPLFLGLALGDVAMMLFWLLIDGWTGRTGHQLMPG